MKTHQVTKREGELIGPTDWSYDFHSHFGGLCLQGERRDEYINASIWRYAQIHEGDWEATTDGGWPRCGWGRVLAVGMYDGWPYWRPVPSVLISGHMGASWHSFSSITGVNELKRDGYTVEKRRVM